MKYIDGCPIVQITYAGLALLPLVDMITDIQATCIYYRNYHFWWGSISALIINCSFRFIVLFYIFKPKPVFKSVVGCLLPGCLLLMLNNEYSFATKKLERLKNINESEHLDSRRKIPLVSKERKNLETAEEPVLKRTVPIISEYLEKLRISVGVKIFVLKHPNLSFRRLFVYCCLIELALGATLPILGPLVLLVSCIQLCIFHMGKAYMQVKTYSGPCKNVKTYPRKDARGTRESGNNEINRKNMEVKVTAFVEAISESLPQIILQSRVYFTGILGWRTYSISVVCSGMSIFKSAIVFYIDHKEMLKLLMSSDPDFREMKAELKKYEDQRMRVENEMNENYMYIDYNNEEIVGSNEDERNEKLNRERDEHDKRRKQIEYKMAVTMALKSSSSNNASSPAKVAQVVPEAPTHPTFEPTKQDSNSDNAPCLFSTATQDLNSDNAMPDCLAPTSESAAQDSFSDNAAAYPQDAQKVPPEARPIFHSLSEGAIQVSSDTTAPPLPTPPSEYAKLDFSDVVAAQTTRSTCVQVRPITEPSQGGPGLQEVLSQENAAIIKKGPAVKVKTETQDQSNALVKLKQIAESWQTQTKILMSHLDQCLEQEQAKEMLLAKKVEEIEGLDLEKQALQATNIQQSEKISHMEKQLKELNDKDDSTIASIDKSKLKFLHQKMQGCKQHHNSS